MHNKAPKWYWKLLTLVNSVFVLKFSVMRSVTTRNIIFCLWRACDVRPHQTCRDEVSPILALRNFFGSYQNSVAEAELLKICGENSPFMINAYKWLSVHWNRLNYRLSIKAPYIDKFWKICKNRASDVPISGKSVGKIPNIDNVGGCNITLLHR